MTQQRKTSPRFAVILTLVASLNYLPVSGIIDAEGRTFGLFALDITTRCTLFRPSGRLPPR